MTDRPDPLTPPGCDLRGYEFMPLFGHKLFSSAFYAESSPEVFRAGIRLWWAAWMQCPAGSLPDSDVALASYADYGQNMKAWKKIRDQALRGFVLCSDGRLYHPMLCQEAIEAYDRRVRNGKKREADRERLQAWRKRTSQTNGNSDETADETPTETVIVTPKPEDETSDETHIKTHVVAGRQDSDSTEERKSTTLRVVVDGRAVDAPQPCEGMPAVDSKAKMLRDGMAIWNRALAGKLRAVEKETDDRRRAFAKRMHDHFGDSLDAWEGYCRRIAASSFMCGNNDRGWRADFDWVLVEKHVVWVIEGRYDNDKKNSRVAVPPSPGNPKGRPMSQISGGGGW